VVRRSLARRPCSARRRQRWLHPRTFSGRTAPVDHAEPRRDAARNASGRRVCATGERRVHACQCVRCKEHQREGAQFQDPGRPQVKFVQNAKQPAICRLGRRETCDAHATSARESRQLRLEHALPQFADPCASVSVSSVLIATCDPVARTTLRPPDSQDGRRSKRETWRLPARGRDHYRCSTGGVGDQLPSRPAERATVASCRPVAYAAAGWSSVPPSCGVRPADGIRLRMRAQ
jgi:hypothetical protein